MYRLATGLSGPTPAGSIVSEVMPDPAAGADYLYVVPANMMIQPLSLWFLLLTDANAADRLPVLQWYTGATTYTFAHSQANHAATLGRTYHWTAGNQNYYYNVGLGVVMNEFPDWLLCSPGDVIRINIIGSRAGDQIAPIHFARRQFIVPG